ncbi:MAG: DUF2089 family protein [Candidatus Omnitrophica bacterium]|nr:DUF2089 family protein [Candidatus Omnitrophota bacterium]
MMKSWIEHLDSEDLAFMKRFLLASGSLKEMARIYSVSYPTVRLRLDRLIQKIQIIEETQESGPFEMKLRMKLADGKIDTGTFRELMALHLEELEEYHEKTDRNS